MELNLPNENTCPYADIQCTDCDKCWVRFIKKEPTPSANEISSEEINIHPYYRGLEGKCQDVY